MSGLDGMQAFALLQLLYAQETFQVHKSAGHSRGYRLAPTRIPTLPLAVSSYV